MYKILLYYDLNLNEDTYCTKYVNNSHLVNDICKCDKDNNGIGYIEFNQGNNNY